MVQWVYLYARYLVLDVYSFLGLASGLPVSLAKGAGDDQREDESGIGVNLTGQLGSANTSSP